MSAAAEAQFLLEEEITWHDLEHVQEVVQGWGRIEQVHRDALQAMFPECEHGMEYVVEGLDEHADERSALMPDDVRQAYLRAKTFLVACAKHREWFDGLEAEQRAQYVSTGHVCSDLCKRQCAHGGRGYLHFCAACDMWSFRGAVQCQRCVCLRKQETPFKDRLGGTCSAYLERRPCVCGQDACGRGGCGVHAECGR